MKIKFSQAAWFNGGTVSSASSVYGAAAYFAFSAVPKKAFSFAAEASMIFLFFKILSSIPRYADPVIRERH